MDPTTQTAGEKTAVVHKEQDETAHEAAERGRAATDRFGILLFSVLLKNQDSLLTTVIAMASHSCSSTAKPNPGFA